MICFVGDKWQDLFSCDWIHWGLNELLYNGHNLILDIPKCVESCQACPVTVWVDSVGSVAIIKYYQ